MDRKSLIPLLIFLPPSLILFVTFVVLPMIDAATFSFFDWTGYGPMTDFVGLEELPGRAVPPQFRHGGAQQPDRGRRVAADPAAAGDVGGARARRNERASPIWIRTLFFLPYMLAEVAAGLIWKFVYDGNYGLVPMIGDAHPRQDAVRAGRQVLGDPGDHAGDRVEVFRLPHDDLHRRPAVASPTR